MKTTYTFLMRYCVLFAIMCVAGRQANAQCHASFTYSINQFTKTITFTNTSTGSGLNYLWLVGDQWSVSASPVITLTHGGMINAGLRITSTTCTDSTNAIIVVNDSCNADFDVVIDTVVAKRASFTAANSSPGTIYLWSFGDFSSSPLQNPQHTYNSYGSYNACLHAVKLNGTDSCHSYVCKWLTFTDLTACDAAFSTTINNGTKTATFSNASTGTGLTYFWKFGDNTTSTLKDPVHVYSSNGTYTVCLKVSSSTSCIDSVCSTFTLSGTSVCASGFTKTNDATNKKIVHFTASNSGLNLTYLWTFGDSTTSALKNPDHTYTNFGSYNVCLKVSKAFAGDTCFSTTCSTITLDNSCNAAFWFSLDSLKNSKKLYFKPTLVYDSNQVYLWDFGDSTGSGLYNPAHIFAASGIYNVCLKITRGPAADTCTNTKCNVVVAGCKADFTTNIDATDKLKFSMSNNSGGANLTFSWNFGNGTTSTLTNPTVTYASPGTYTICLVTHSTFDTTCSETKCKNVIVTDSGTCYANFNSQPDTAFRIYHFQHALAYRPNVDYLWTLPDSSTHAGYSLTAYLPYASNRICLKTTWHYNGTDSCVRSNCIYIAYACSSNFTFTTDAVNKLKKNFSVQASTVSPIYYWTFGDSTSSTTAAPSKIYSQPGIYSVCLRVTSSKDSLCVSNTCKTVTVTNSANCQARFEFARDTSYLKYHFVNTSLGDSNNFSWSFGDGSANSTLKNPDHTFPHAGVYLVCLNASRTGCSSYYCDTVYVDTLPRACVADFDYSVYPWGRGAAFTSTSAGLHLKYNWSFGDGTTSTLKNPTHYYSKLGHYQVCLYVYDSVDPNCGGGYCDLVEIAPFSCTADFNFGRDSLDTGTYYFNPLTVNPQSAFYWDFGDGDTSTYRWPMHTFASFGMYIVCLRVVNIYDSCDITHCDTVYVGTTGLQRLNGKQLYGMNIYPNPFDDHITLDIQGPGPGRLEVAIYDISGRLYYSSSTMNTQQVKINTQELPRGIYLLRLASGTETYHVKLIK